MCKELEPGYMVFQIFALEIYRADPALFSKSLEMARKNVIFALKHCAKDERVGLEAQLQAADSLHGLTGLMELLRKDRPQDLPDLGLDNIRI